MVRVHANVARHKRVKRILKRAKGYRSTRSKHLKDAKDTLKLPPGVSFEDAALIEPLACCVKAMNRVVLRPGESVAIIGLGAMGAGMAGNLFRAGHLSRAWNRSPERAQAAAAQHGFALADSLEAAAGQADLVITSVSADADLMQVVERLCRVMTAGSVVLDTSTVSIDTARKASERLEAHGIHFLDGNHENFVLIRLYLML